MRKVLMAMAAVALLATGCGGGGGDDEEDGDYGSDLLTDTTVTVPPGATTTVTAAPRRTVQKPPPAARVTIPSANSTPPKPVTKDNLPAAAKGPVGELAPFVLQAQPVRTVVIEILFQEGLDLRSRTINHITSEIKRYSANKTVTVERTPLPPGPSAWTLADEHRYADRYARFKSAESTAAFRFLVLRGHPDSEGAIGRASRADHLAIFPDTYRHRATPTLSYETIEDAVSMHEMGHLLALVDFYLSTGRGDYKDDPAPGGHHSPNKRSVMYYAMDGTGLFSIFEGGAPTEYDDADRRDLFAIRDGAAKGSKGTTGSEARSQTPMEFMALHGLPFNCPLPVA